MPDGPEQPAPSGRGHTKTNMSIDTKPRQGRAPELALRLRKAAAILTRAACLAATDAELPSTAYRLRGELRYGRVSTTTLYGVLRQARIDLFPFDPLAHDKNHQHDDFAMSAAVLIMGGYSKDAATLKQAAQRCREWADFEEAVITWGTPQLPPAHYQPFKRNGMWRFSTPYGLSDEFRHEFDAQLRADIAFEEDELVRETAAKIRRSSESSRKTSHAEVAA